MSDDSLLDIWGMRKRGKRDSARHTKRVKKAIKDNLKDLVADASIISSDGKKKIKIPIRYLDSYRFKHGGLFLWASCSCSSLVVWTLL